MPFKWVAWLLVVLLGVVHPKALVSQVRPEGAGTNIDIGVHLLSNASERDGISSLVEF